MLERVCGLCFHIYSNLKQHLTVSHKIPNKDEFRLLMQYGNARFPGSLDCTICDNKGLLRLDKHLQDVHALNKEERDPLIKTAKRMAVVKLMADLRSSNPEVPMVSSLDTGITGHDAEEQEDVFELLTSNNADETPVTSGTTEDICI